jgi:single-stranded-DNA-specific exonuclease
LNRLNIQQIKELLGKRVKNDKYKTLKDMPKPSEFKDMQKATVRIVKAIKNDETINIIGDYDADGVNSTAIMIEFFNKAVGVEINHIIPNRFKHGYGVSEKVLDMIYDGIIITVDNGISAIIPAEICKQRDIDLIITDHHTVGKILPDAYAIINPKQKDCNFPFSEICGAHIAWYLCASIKQELNLQYNLMELFDFLTIAIVADIMPMISLNQTIVKKGLKLLATSKRPAFVVLKERFGFSNIITEEDIGFKIAPLINCAGRMKDASIALDFLLSFDIYEAKEHLEYLIELNEKRKEEQLSIYEASKLQVDNKDDVIVVASEDWNEGIIGIVASKLCDKYKKPSFVFQIKDNIAKASARSVANINLYNLITEVQHLTIGYGGHKGAAGLIIQKINLDEFKIQINEAIQAIPNNDKILSSEYFASIDLSDVQDKLYNVVNLYRPYGLDNPLPVFYFENISIINIILIGKNKEYKKLVVSNNIVNIDVLVFIETNNLAIGDSINLTATIGKNEFRGEVTFNLILKDLISA